MAISEKPERKPQPKPEQKPQRKPGQKPQQKQKPPLPPPRDDSAVRTWLFVREAFTAGTWRRVAYALLAFPVGVLCVPLALLGAPTGRWQRGLVRRFLGRELSGSSRDWPTPRPPYPSISWCWPSPSTAGPWCR
ncbi:hypothetical protein O1M63_13345 [Streptomyces mirabilis]|nr:hypothetical protein [Streptomyces mirabilis]